MLAASAGAAIRAADELRHIASSRRSRVGSIRRAAAICHGLGPGDVPVTGWRRAACGWVGGQSMPQEWRGAALTGGAASRWSSLVGAVVGGTTSARAGRTTTESSLFGVGDSAGDQFTGNTVGHLRQGLSSGDFSGWCERWRRRRSSPADAVRDSPNGSLDNRGNVGEWRFERGLDAISLAPSYEIDELMRGHCLSAGERAR